MNMVYFLKIFIKILNFLILTLFPKISKQFFLKISQLRTSLFSQKKSLKLRIIALHQASSNNRTTKRGTAQQPNNCANAARP